MRANAERLTRRRRRRRGRSLADSRRRGRDDRHAAGDRPGRRGISIGFMCCTCRRATRRICWASITPATATRLAALITAEACPHHLLLNMDDYARLGTLAQMNPSLKIGRRQSPAVAGAGRRPHSGDRHRPRAAHARGKGEAVSAVALGHAERREQPRPDAQRSASRPLHARAGRPLDVRRPGPRVGHRRQGPHRRRLRRRPGAGRPAPQSRTVRNAEQLTKCGWSAWDGVELTGWPVRTWVRGREVFRDGRSTTTSAARRPCSITPAAATGRPAATGESDDCIGYAPASDRQALSQALAAVRRTSTALAAPRTSPASPGTSAFARRSRSGTAARRARRRTRRSPASCRRSSTSVTTQSPPAARSIDA